MKTRKKELNVDFIGGVGLLTEEEEKRISEVIKNLKDKQSSTRKPTKKSPTKKRVTARSL